MWIYRKIDKTVKMYINSYQSTVFISLKELCLCCFRTVSCPINTILASFNVLVAEN